MTGLRSQSYWRNRDRILVSGIWKQHYFIFSLSPPLHHTLFPPGFALASLSAARWWPTPVELSINDLLKTPPNVQPVQCGVTKLTSQNYNILRMLQFSTPQWVLTCTWVLNLSPAHCHPFHSPAHLIYERSHSLNTEMWWPSQQTVSAKGKSAQLSKLDFKYTFAQKCLLFTCWAELYVASLTQKDCIMRKTLSACQNSVAIYHMVPGKAASMCSARKMMRKYKSPT